MIWWLTGGPRGGAHVTDVTNASRTLLMDLESGQWDGELCEAMGVPEALLQQLAIGGRLVLPVGEREQNLVVIERTANGFERREVEPVRFVPLVPGLGNA